MLCKNVLSLNGYAAEVCDEDDYFVTVFCGDAARCDYHTNESIWETVDELQRLKPRLPAREFGELEQAAGFSHSPHNILLDADLRQHVLPESNIMYDWVHVWLTQGLASDEIWFYVCHLRSTHNIRYADINAFVCSYNLPAHVSVNIGAIFGEKREKSSMSADAFKAGASEILSIYACLLRFHELVVAPLGNKCDRQGRSLQALCLVLDALQCVSLKLVSPQRLRERIQTHLALYTAAYGRRCAKPKFHYAIHFPRFLEKTGTLFNCFTCERRHKCVKMLASLSTYTGSYEKTVLTDFLLAHAEMLNESGALARGCAVSKTKAITDPMLLNFVKSCCPDLDVVLVGEVGRNGMVKSSVGDCVVIEDGASWRIASVIAFFECVPLRHFAFVERAQPLGGHAWKLSDEYELVPLASIAAACSYAPGDHGAIDVLYPPYLSCRNV